jgi:diphthamide synthase (EF-2-diphthine--ammonia ligase)
MASLGIDLAGEAGEHHTAVIDGPVFGQPIQVRPLDRLPDQHAGGPGVGMLVTIH